MIDIVERLRDDYEDRWSEAEPYTVIDTYRDERHAAADEIERLRAERDKARRDRDLAISHDRQPYPTQWAYDRVCAARTKWQERAEKAEAELAALKAMRAAFEAMRDNNDVTTEDR